MLTNPLKDHIFLDIETIPDQKEGAMDRARQRVQAPANYKDPEKIAAYIRERAEDAWLKTSLDGTYGEVICVTYAFEDGEPETLVRLLDEGETERDLLEKFWQETGDLLVVNPVWVGHRVADFDLRFLYHRSVINQVKPSYRIGPDMKPWAPNIKDTSFMWTGQANSGISLDNLAQALGLRSPKELADGSEVWGLVVEGAYDALVEYNRGDTLTTREVYKRLAFIP